jgi:aminoglycoside phosphotransferase (APT) family kinase protein
VIPSDLRLLQNARFALRRVAESTIDVEASAALNAVDVVLNELMLRQDTAFFSQRLLAGMDLAQQGAQVVPSIDSNAFEAAAAIAHSSVADMCAALERLTKHLQSITDAASASNSLEAKTFLERVTEWEVGLYAHQMKQLITPMDVPDDPRRRFTAAAFTDYLRRKFPERAACQIEDFQILPGGFSKITILAKIAGGAHGIESVVIRAEPPLRFMELDGADIRNEYPVIKIAFAAGIPVAEPLWFEEDMEWFGMRFIVSRQVAGKIYGTVKGADDPVSERALRDLAAILAAVHAIPLSHYPDAVKASHLAKWCAYPRLRENTLAFIEYWRHQARIAGIGASPVVARGLNWLKSNVPPDDGPVVLIHGDIGLHNILIHGDKVAALLDWEISRVGDPVEDLTNLLSGTEGAVNREQLLDWYRAAGGQPISEFRMRYFDVYHGVKQTIAALASLRRVEDYRSAHINLAVFGLQYLHYVVSRLNRLIRVAEAQYNSDPGA